MRSAIFIGPSQVIDTVLIQRLDGLYFSVECFHGPDEFLFDGQFLENCVYFIYCCPGNITGNNLIKLLRIKDKVSLIYAVSFDVSQSSLEQSLFAGADFSVEGPLHPERCVVEVQNHFRKMDFLMEIKRKGGVELISEGHTVLRNGKALKLTTIEFEIFRLLFHNLDKTLSREEIISSIPSNDSNPRTVDAHVCTLRRKMDPMKIYIDTVRGIGYQLSIM